MGSLLSCCGEPQNEAQYDRETLRELQAQAAEKRMQENEKRGVKNVESVKRQQERKNQMENMEDNRIGSGSNNLRWQVS